MPRVADLANALGIVVTGGHSCLKNFGADEKIVTDFNGEQQTCA
jgi:hypothetical protein